MFHDILFLILGLGFVLLGANFLTDGASAIARRFHVSELIIGVTIVAFGSSTPDLVVCLTSTLSGKAAMAVGSIVGANIFDILLVIGVCAVIHPILVGKSTLQKEFPMVILSSLVLSLMAFDVLIDRAHVNLINRTDGLILLCFFAINCYITYKIAKSPDTETTTAGNTSKNPKTIKMGIASVMVVIGLAGLIVGGKWFVANASSIAARCGMSESLIGLTIVAIGSSLPDLSTSVVAAAKGHSDIAVGNVVGSCVLNVFFIIGLCATIRPLDLGTINWIDFAVLTGGSVLLWIFGWMWGKSTIRRSEGVMLILCYVGYMCYLILSNK